MSAYAVEDSDVWGCVSRAVVYGLDESIRRAKFPKSATTVGISGELTDGIAKIASAPIGSGHDQWLTGVVVQFDLTFSIKAWVEAERYHFFDFVSSQSTMHKIAEFDFSRSCVPYVDERIVKIMQEKADRYNELCASDAPPSERHEAYLQLLYSNPAGFRLTAGITTNYRQLKTIYAQRRGHMLPEWYSFCRWMEGLPHSELITGGANARMARR